MNNKLEMFKNVVGGNDAVEQILTLLNLPDEEFDKIYPTFVETIDTIFQNEELQKEILTSIKKDISSDGDMGSLKEVIDSINESFLEEDYSKNKKEFLTLLMNKTYDLIVDLNSTRREKINVKIKKLDERAALPTYAHNADAGADVSSIEDIEIKPNETVLVRTGLAVLIPAGYEIQLRPRSGLSLKTNLRIANAPATIDQRGHFMQ